MPTRYVFDSMLKRYIISIKYLYGWMFMVLYVVLVKVYGLRGERKIWKGGIDV